MAEPLVALPDVSIPVATEIPIGPKPVGSGAGSRSAGIYIGRFVVLLVFLAIAGFATIGGLRLRAWTWDQTAAVHYFPDINSSIDWGKQALQPMDRPRGFLNVYDVVAATSRSGGDRQPNYVLDYAPLRLLLVTRWVYWLQQVDPTVLGHAAMERDGNPASAWEAKASQFAPLLRFNDGTEFAACIGLFLLTRHWVIRGDKRIGSICRAGQWGSIMRPFRGCVAGLIAMLLFWFSPAVIVGTHGWPTTDEWIIPFFVWAIYLACTDWWFIAGVVIAIGANFKGQQFFVAPLFVLWPLFSGRWRSALRWVAGLTLTIALIASPWLLTYLQTDSPAQASAADRHIDWAAMALVMAVAVCLVAAPTVWQAWRTRRGLERPVNLLTVPLYRIAACLCLGMVLLASGGYFRGSYNWLVIGWGYRLQYHPQMTMGFTDNLAGLLSGRFGWQQVTDIVYTFAPHPLRLWPSHRVLFVDPTDVPMRALLIALYCVALLACTIGMAIQSRRNDPHFLVAATGVWLMFFTLLPEIHERYLLYAAGVGCSLVACGLGMTLLNIFLTLLTMTMTMHVMLSDAHKWGRLAQFGSGISNTFGASCLHFCATTHPDAGWAVVLAAAIFLYCSFSRSPVWTAWQPRFESVSLPPGESREEVVYESADPLAMSTRPSSAVNSLPHPFPALQLLSANPVSSAPTSSVLEGETALDSPPASAI